MESPHLDVATHWAVLASADDGCTGNNLRDLTFVQSCGNCQFYRGCWVLHIDNSSPSIRHLLAILRVVPPAQLNVEDLYIHEALHTSSILDDNTLTARACLDEVAVIEIHELLYLLSRTLRTLTIIRSSAQPFNPQAALFSKRLLEGLEFPVLEELAVQGPPQTMKHLVLPITTTFSPRLRRLRLPSDALQDNLVHAVRAHLPQLSQLSIYPLRPSYTLSQLTSLLRLGEYVGVIGQTACRVDNTSSSTTHPCSPFLEVMAYAGHTPFSRAAIERFTNTVSAKVLPKMSKCFKIRVVDKAEPTYAERVDAEVLGFMARRRLRILGF